MFDWGGISLLEGQATTKGLHLAVGAGDRAAVNAWWETLATAGYQSDGEPGLRPQDSETYYGAFVLDPDGHNVEAVFHER
jgi:predicted lactoylglutathione lyase